MRDKFSGLMLREAREECFLTQQNLAVLMEVSRGTVISWENGTHKPSLKHIKALKRLLNVRTFEEPQK